MTTATQTTLTIKAEVRTDLGKEKIKKARKVGNIPAVIYGAKSDPISLYLNEHDLKMKIQEAKGERRLLNIELSDGSTAMAFFKVFQRDPVTDRIIHVDFLRVNPSEDVTIRIPVRHHGGIPAGVKLGGLLEQIEHKIRVSGKPESIPPFVSVDLTNVSLAQTIHISELPAIDGIEYVGAPSAPVFTIAAKGKDAKDALREIINAEREAEAKAAAEAEEAEGEE